jgi:HAE1 family hydrophobic/amphiphilic exporter-1
MKRSSLFLAALAAAGVAGAAELDLDRAVATALADNPGLRAVEALRGQVAGGIREARADAFPQLALNAGWGQSRSPAFLNSPDFEGILEQFPGGVFEPGTQELSTATIELTQPLWTFGKVGAAVDLAELVAGAAEEQIATARLDVALAAAEAYLQVLAAREGLATVESQREFRRRDLERIESLLELGEATELERLRAVAALAVVEPEVERRRGQVTVAETRLRQLLALPAGEPLELAPAREALPEPPPVERALAEALADRPELLDLALQSAAYGKQQQVTRADGRPQLELTGFWGREVRLVTNLEDPLYSSWAFNFGLRWEFFDGGRRRAQIAQLDSQRQQLELQRQDLAARLRLAADQALGDYRTARARAAAAETAAGAAREAERVARESYEQGIVTQTELLDAQSQAVSAAVVAVEAFYDARIQAARLARALGRMPNAGWTEIDEAGTR